MKSGLLDLIITQLSRRLDRLTAAAREAHAAATDPDSKAENKYDTRTIEASYLAAGQSRQVEELSGALETFRAWSLPDYEPASAIDIGALVKTEINGEAATFLLVPTGGGLEVEKDGTEITLLSPASDLYRKLSGLHVGDTLATPPLKVLEVS